MPALLGCVVDPLVGAAADTPRRRTVLIAGGVFVALSTALAAASVCFWTLLLAPVALLVLVPRRASA